MTTLTSPADERRGLYRSWDWIAADAVSGGSGPAAYAMNRLVGWTAAVVRGGVGLVGGVAGIVGASGSVSLAWVAPAAAANWVWAAVFGWVAFRWGLRSWAMAGDVAVAVALCLCEVRLVPHDVLPGGSSWVAVIASLTLVLAHLAWRPAAAVPAGVVIVTAFLTGAAIAGQLLASLFQAGVLTVQISATTVLMLLVRRASAAADTALSEQQRTLEAAAAEQARRAEEREQNRNLHDTVLATLTIVGTGAIDDASQALRARAEHDLAVISGIVARRGPDDDRQVRVDSMLTDMVRTAHRNLRVRLVLLPCLVPAAVGEAITAAAAEALTNVARHAHANVAGLRLTPGSQMTVEITDDGDGFDPDDLQAHRYGLRQAIVGRVEAVGGGVSIDSRPGRGTHIRMWWPHD